MDGRRRAVHVHGCRGRPLSSSFLSPISLRSPQLSSSFTTSFTTSFTYIYLDRLRKNRVSSQTTFQSPQRSVTLSETAPRSMIFLRTAQFTGCLSILSCILSSTLFAFYIIMFHKKYKDPSTGVAVAKGFAMVYAVLYALCALATGHALFVATRRIGAGLFTLFSLIATSLDITYFVLVVKRNGLNIVCDAIKEPRRCKRYKLLLGVSIFIWLCVVVRVLTLLTVLSYHVAHNVTVPITTSSSTVKKSTTLPTSISTSNPSTSTSQKLQSLPKFLRKKRGYTRAEKGKAKEEEAIELYKPPSTQAGYFELTDREESESEDEEKHIGRSRSSSAASLRRTKAPEKLDFEVLELEDLYDVV